ncbi:hypothetical protein GGR51DRAFT_179523 [Nemania sp. FL0031]|nr:hypothetical protein GGR51DRAFT_179523 [Nemania sp. FL0031]
MDPLSVTASVIAIIGTLSTVRKGYKAIADLGKASQEMGDLINEVESVHAYLEMLHSVLDMGSSTQTFVAIDLLPSGAALSRLEYTIRELQSALKQVKTDANTNESSRRISKLKWQVYKPKVIQLRGKIRYRKQDLVDKIGLLQLALSMVHAALLPNTCAIAETSYLNHRKPSSEQVQSEVLLKGRKNDLPEAGSHCRPSQHCSTRCPCRCHRYWIMGFQPALPSNIRQLL